MFKPISNVLVVLIMLVAFVGQALAYSSMACEMAGDPHQAHMMMQEESASSHQSMDHENMSHAQMDHSNMSSSDDCCGIDCMCPASACTSFTFVTEHAPFSNTTMTNEAIVLPAIEQPSSLPSSLYRPPIFA